MSKKPIAGSKEFDEELIIRGDLSSQEPLSPIKVTGLIQKQQEDELKAVHKLVFSKAASFTHLLTSVPDVDPSKVAELIKERKSKELREIYDLIYSKEAFFHDTTQIISKLVAIQGSNTSEVHQDSRLAAYALDYSKNTLDQVKQELLPLISKPTIEPDTDTSFVVEVMPPPHVLPNSLQKIQNAQEEQNQLLREQNQLIRAQTQSLSEQSVAGKKKGQPVTKTEGFQDVKSVSIKERNKMLAVILAMAIDQYEYDPQAKRNTATGGKAKSIKAGLEKLGLEIDEDTIKSYLKEAFEIHKDSIDSKKI